MTSPVSIFQFKRLPVSAFCADTCSSGPSVNEPDLFTEFFCLPLYFLKEGIETDIADFASPHSLHTLDTQIFKNAPVISAEKFQCEFPMMISTSVMDFSMPACRSFSTTFSVIATLLRFGMLPVASRNIVPRLPIELWTFNLFSITTRQHSFESEIKPCSYTCLRFYFNGFVVSSNGNIEIV